MGLQVLSPNFPRPIFCELSRFLFINWSPLIASHFSLTHGPPANILDLTFGGDNAGCETLAARLPLLRPRLHVFGHIHEAHGAQIQTYPLIANLPSGPTTLDSMKVDDSQRDRTVFVNAANWPTRHGVRGGDHKLQFGGPGCQPVIVDLLDTTTQPWVWLDIVLTLWVASKCTQLEYISACYCPDSVTSPKVINYIIKFYWFLSCAKAARKIVNCKRDRRNSLIRRIINPESMFTSAHWQTSAPGPV